MPVMYLKFHVNNYSLFEKSVSFFNPLMPGGNKKVTHT